ncbi:MAG: TetR family transcriptional regulator [Myxococcales bacterium]|nr:TetR family transcriptional regulator [Myxococcales bacterium]
MVLRERARKAEDKELRRRAILDAARTVFAERGWSGFAMSEVAARSGVVKGTLYLYWPTREELLLAVLEELLWAWMAELDARLDDARAPAGPRTLAAVVCESLSSYEPLGRLLAVLQTVLEHNVTRPSVLRFKTTLLERAAATGARFERHVPKLADGEGVRVLLHLNAILVGLVQMADSAPMVRELLSVAPLSALKVDLPRELRAALTTYFLGIQGR